jgi:O-antigen ligase
MIELAYTFFLLSGFIKFFFLLLGGVFLVIDFTLLSAVMLLALYAYHFASNLLKNEFHMIRPARPVIFAQLAFYVWIVATLTYTQSQTYCFIKTGMFLTDVIALLFPLLYRGFNFRRFLSWFVYIGTGLISIYTLLLPKLFSSYMRFYSNREFIIKYLDIGYLSGLNVLLIAFAFPRMKRITRILLIGVNALSLLVTAARGPIVFLSLVLLVKLMVEAVRFFRTSWTFSFKNIFYLLVGLGLLGAGASYMADKYSALLERTVRRLLLLLDPSSSSVAKRLSQIDFSLDHIFHNAASFLFGTGIGSFGIIYDGIDQRQYPHNVILEIWFELGVIGVILFLVMLLIYFKKICFNFNFVLIFTYLMLNSMKSYSLMDSRLMFGILGIILLYAIDIKRADKKPLDGESAT